MNWRRVLALAVNVAVWVALVWGAAWLIHLHHP
jgi:hypothetical protein